MSAIPPCSGYDIHISPHIVIERLGDTPLPKYATEGAACIDLYAAEACSFVHFATIPVGIKLRIPHNYVGLVMSRSGLASKGIFVVNAPGVIDSDYRGEIKVILGSVTEEEVEVRKGDRIAQLMFQRLDRIPMELGIVFNDTARGTGGFGSTGV